MKKKLLVLVCTFAMALGLTACGNKEEVTYGGFTAKDFENNLQTYMSQLEGIGESDIDGYIEYYKTTDEITCAVLEDWKECVSQKGEFVGFSDFSLDKSGKTLTATLVTDYSNRDLKLIFVFNANHVENGPTAINVEPVYTLGETMQKAGLNTVMGILIVFTMLVVMSLIISLFKFIPDIKRAFSGQSKAPEAPVAAAAAPVSVNDDLELIAVIAAAIAASTGASTDSFVVRSIKKRR